ncbi:MAG: hypothetical protein ACRC4W_07210 [Treponemataceae bacterium]
MVKLLLKKNFYEVWDNLLLFALYNFFFILMGIGTFFFLSFASIHPILLAISIFIVIPACMILLCSANKAIADLSNYKSIHIKDFFTNIPRVWKFGLLFGLFVAALIFFIVIGIPFYLSLNHFIGLFLSGVLFWLSVIFLLALQWTLPIYAQLDNNIKKALKKSFILLFDNMKFSIYLLLNNTIFFIFLALISINYPFFSGLLILFLVIPGLSGLLLSLNNAFKLRLYKYDWLDKQPKENIKKLQKNIPWEELLQEDEEIIGDRTLKDFIFPWK